MRERPPGRSPQSRAEQIWAASGDARTVVNVVAGTGNYEPKDPREVAVEPAVGMLAKGATQSLALIKYLVHKSLSMDFEEALDLAHVAQEQVRKTEDHKEAVQAFLEKRQPEFKPESTEGGRRVSVLKRQEGAPVLLG